MVEGKYNRYSPPTSNIEIDTQRNPSRLGLLFGAAFMIPFILFPVYGGFKLWSNGLIERIPNLVFLSLPLLEGLYFGWWCGEASHKYSYLLLITIALLQGTCMFVVFMFGLALFVLFTKGYHYEFGLIYIQVMIFLWLVFTIWSYFMAAAIRWRVLKLVKLQETAGD